jgi:hypothetical protein
MAIGGFMSEYHKPESCNRCRGVNEVISVSSENGVMSEGKTKCSKCGFEDYWAYGYFESGNEAESKCEKYNLNN